MIGEIYAIIAPLVWLGFCALVGVYAQRDERSGPLWFFISLLFTPILAGIILTVLQEQAARSRGIK